MSQGKRGELSSPPDDNRYHPYRSSNPAAKKPYRGQPSFPVGASNSGPSACALCLGRFRHPIHKCASEFLWDKRTKTHCHRNAEGHLVNPEGFEICYNWQRPKGCSNTTRSHVHKCSKDAGQRIMELRAALKARASKARTPYQPEVWSRFLSAAGLIHKYAHIPNGFHFGFMGSVPTIHHTYSPPNSPSLLTQHDTFATILDREYSTGRYIGPLSKTETETLIGPFQTAPLAMVPKPGKPGKFRLVQNLSFPLHPSATSSISSINSAIDFDLYPCTWAVLLPRYASLSGPFLQVHKRQFVTWRKHIGQFPSTLPNGQVWLSEQGKIASQLTAVSVSVFLRLQGLIAGSQMQVLTSSDHKELVRYPNGWMTIYSSESSMNISRHTMTYYTNRVLPLL